jgi:hypothetical protein
MRRTLLTLTAFAALATGVGCGVADVPNPTAGPDRLDTTVTAAPCHPHPEVCEAEALTGTGHMPAEPDTDGVGTLGPLQWWNAATAPRAAR